MSETPNSGQAPAGQAVDGQASAGAAATPTPSPVPDGTATKVAAASGKTPDLKDGRSNKVQRAHARALAKLSADQGADAKASGEAADGKESTLVPDQQAGGSDAAATGTGDAGKPGSQAAGADGAPAAPASTLDAPADWPEKQRAAFSGLPEAARATVLSFYRDMQAGFTRATQKLAAERESIGELAKLRDAFEKDPKAVLADLAKAKNVELFFERPLPEGQVPDFKDAAEMAQWVADKVARETVKAREVERGSERARQEAAQAEADVKRELGEATGKFADFGAHREAVFGVLLRAPGLKVEEAYQLATYPALMKAAGNLEALKRENATLKAEAERRAKLASAPPQAAAANGRAKEPLDHLSPAQRAYKRAQARINASA